jgi:DNA-binding NtrC family response regulator
MTSSPAHEPAPCTDLKGLRVLLVEDSWHLGMALENLLREMGAHVFGPAATCAEADDLIGQQAVDAALVDFHLRGGERAFGLIDRLNGLGIRVVVMTGQAIIPLAASKAAAVLQKPFTEAQLVANLLPALGRKDVAISTKTVSDTGIRRESPPVR